VGLTAHQHRQVICIILIAIDQLKIEALCQHRGNHSQYILRKRLAKANTLATVEWHPAELRALRSIRSLRVRVRLIEAVRVESFWLLPIHSTKLERAVVDHDRVVGFDM